MEKLLTSICVTMSFVFTVSAFAQEKGTQTTKLLIDNGKYRVNETLAKPGEKITRKNDQTE